MHHFWSPPGWIISHALRGGWSLVHSHHTVTQHLFCF